ncbi:MAG: hypothetical protein M3362_00655 [Acidobacteriota bacterium]|nr:hypothetical protein [Acidobacteriota bacterium]
MAKYDSVAHEKIIESLTSSSPFLSEAAGLLGQTTLLTLGLSTTDPDREKQSGGRFRADGAEVADLVTRQATIVSQAAPDLALAAPDLAVSAIG